MVARVAIIHACSCNVQVVDGRATPDHDGQDSVSRPQWNITGGGLANLLRITGTLFSHDRWKYSAATSA
jgi:hypothetical protein